MEGSLLPSNALPVILKLATGTSFRTRAARLGLLGLSGMSVLRWLTAPKVIQVWSKGSDVPKKRKSGVGVNAKFYSQLVYVLRICIPTWRSKTFGILVMHTLFLVLRTYLSLVVATLDGRLVKDLVGHFLVAFKRVFSHPTNGMKVAADGHEFAKGLAYWFAIALPATYVNSMIRYLQSKLGIALRTSLTRYVHDLYMSNNSYYKAINLDHRIDGADQLITTDINRFCTALAQLYSNLGKPVLDMIIFNYQLARSIGVPGMTGLAINYLVTANVMRAVTPAFGKLIAEEAKLEGDFRMSHSRLITNAEEIAFYNGEDREKSILNRTYSSLIKHINSTYRIKIAFNMFEDFVIKYCWSSVGLMIASIPVFMPEYAGGRTKRIEKQISLLDAQESQNEKTLDRKTGSRTQGFITNKRLLINLGDAGGRIMYSYKELSELAGYTHRVFNLISVMEDLSMDKFSLNQGASSTTGFSIDKIKGDFVYGADGITFDHVPITTPFGDTVLVKDLSFSVKPGDHLMITGPNGAGKTSILRVLSGLWPHFQGRISRPDRSLDSIIYIPQRPYLSVGTLRDQIIYPHTQEEMRFIGKTDADLREILKIVYLDYIPDREGGMDVIKEWKDVFSGGEKQRVQLARIFYHKPRFAILDEATSAVSNDVEALLYTSTKEAGITMITISHRPNLLKYHSFLLKVGEGNDGTEWEWVRMGSRHGLTESVSNEIKKLEEQLKNTASLRKRLAEIIKALNLDNKEDIKHAKRSLV